MKNQLKCAWIQYQEKVVTKKTMVLLVIQFFAIYMFCKPLISFSEAVSYPVMPLVYPFVISDIRFLFLFMLGVVYHFSDVPFMQYEGMYQIIRMGRIRWAVNQITTILFRSFVMIGVNIAFCCLIFIRRMDIGNGWGKLLHTAALTDAGERYHFIFTVNQDTINQMGPMQLTALTWLICGLVVSFIVLIMFILSLYIGRGIAITMVVVMNVMIFLVSNVHPVIRQRVASFVPIVWMQVADLTSKKYNSFKQPELSYILTVLIVGTLILAIGIIGRVRRCQFDFVKEEA